MKIEVNGQTINLSKTDFLSQGGEGSVYVRGDTAYKIYHNSNKMIPVAKINELSVIEQQRIIKPQLVIYDKNTPIGYTMRFVKDTHPLCKLFTKSFKQRNNINNTFELVRTLQDGVKHIHDKKILIVDLNELNFLVSSKFDDIFFIDVDSYQTSSFSATAIMESIRDRHAKKFSIETDWFSWGIVTFQLLIGIHPYKGRHTSVNDLEERMQKNISVFNKEVSVPKLCEPFDVIPEVYRNWYRAVFEDGKRMIPPDSLHAVIVVAPTTKNIIGSNLFNIEEIFSFKENINSIFYGRNRYAFMNSKIICNKGIETKHPVNSCIHFVKEEYFVWNDNGKLQIENQHGRIELVCNSNKFMQRDGRVYIHDDDKIYELVIRETTNNKFIASLSTIANVLPRATQIYSGVAMENILNMWFAVLPYETGKCKQVALKELKDYRIIDAKSNKNMLMVIGYKNGIYDKFIYCFDSDFSHYELVMENNVSNLEVNFTVLDNNICAHLNDKDELELFAAKYGASSQKKIFNDSILSHDMKLVSQGVSCQFIKGNSLYSIKVK